jgi:drug/metabolite transporter (DMT)-like permease
MAKIFGDHHLFHRSLPGAWRRPGVELLRHFLVVYHRSTVAPSFVLSRPLARDLPSLTITAFGTAVPRIRHLIVGLTKVTVTFPDTTAGTTRVIGNALCYAIRLVCLYGSIVRLGALRTAILINAQPLVSVAAAFLVLGQTIGLLQMAGALIVVPGIFLLTTPPETRWVTKQSD